MCETWVKPSELAYFKNIFKSQNCVSYLKSSIDPESVLTGRPYGGVGFVCKRTQGFSFYPIDCSNDRISVIKVKSGSRVSVTLIGVYMPYHNGSAAQVESYVETLAELQSVIDNNDVSPIMILGDMNTCLPKNEYLDRKWYKRKPFNRYSLLLYDFMVLSQKRKL